MLQIALLLKIPDFVRLTPIGILRWTVPCVVSNHRSRVLRVATAAAIAFGQLSPMGNARILAQLVATAYSAPSANTNVPELIAGRVVNAVTGAPLARTLVQIGGRAMFTDQEGQFQFQQPGQPVSTLRLTKPGFSMSPEQMDGPAEGAFDGTDPGSLSVALWPEALLVGVVQTADSEPVPHIAVLVRRSLFDEQGHHFQVVAQQQTDSHGQFRFPVPAGDYRLETQFSPKGFEGQQALLPYTFPPHTLTATADALHVGSGEEQHIELRPGTSNTHAISLPLEAGEEGQPPQITAHSSDGTSFAVNASRSQEPGSLRLDLPSGTYSLHATRYSREGIQFGESSVTVPDHDISGPTLHLSSLPKIPVETIVDTSTTQTSSSGGGRPSDTTPSAMQFNLALQPIELDSTSSFQFGIRPTQQRDSRATLSAPPGAYRLTASIGGGWYIRSASSRGTDLLRENLVISPGSSPSAITLVVSNQMGSVQGTVKLSGVPSTCWVYLIAASPALPPVVVGRSDSGGRFNISLPPGSYRAVAFPFRHSANLQDPAVLNRFSTHVGGASVSAGSSSNLDLDSVTSKELVP